MVGSSVLTLVFATVKHEVKRGSGRQEKKIEEVVWELEVCPFLLKI